MNFNETLIFDGAMGTMIEKYGYSGTDSERLILEHPEVIERIHKEYVKAGADCIIASTFTASRPHLTDVGLEDKQEELNIKAVEIAKSSGASYVLADIGPTGLMLEPFGDTSNEELCSYFTVQAKALIEAKPDAIIIETIIDVNEALCALKAVKALCDIPTIVSCSYSEHGRTMFSGTVPKDACTMCADAGADAIGANCGLGPDLMEPIVCELLEYSDLPVLVQPNAGMPQIQTDGSTLYPCSAKEMARWAKRYKAAGLHLMGSCCGSSPAYTKEIFKVFHS